MKRLGMATSLVVVLMVAFAMVAWAKGPANVYNTAHNLSSYGVGYPDPTQDAMGENYTSNTSQVCVFCHTPHGGLIEGPLWNRNLPAANGFTHYSSTTLSNAVIGAVGRDVGDESRLCMSCHDGTATLDHLINVPNDIQGIAALAVNSAYNQAIVTGVDGNGGLIDDLSDDHPISFNYTAVQTQALVYGLGGTRAGELHTIDEAKAAGVRFFGATNRVECSSCHDPHVDYSTSGNPDYTPFLITTNKGSNLCRACHNK